MVPHQMQSDAPEIRPLLPKKSRKSRWIALGVHNYTAKQCSGDLARTKYIKIHSVYKEREVVGKRRKTGRSRSLNTARVHKINKNRTERNNESVQFKAHNMGKL
ncbi:hypothetical protein OESDEN_03866 [Oesophagostomum dentatum]|uniref:Uncharacterized protein n=1 Tax=Oesophagostomum dentatum TaxID=61180 RepID=A0A0B1TF84_OESDE|nr:hypothetical protein OESDEN_03866 [Oesophagostomum dentatum]